MLRVLVVGFVDLTESLEHRDVGQSRPVRALVRKSRSLGLALGVTLCMLTLTPVPSGAASTESDVSSGAPSGGVLDIVLTAGSCTETSFCMAVGYEPDSPMGNVPFSEQWNGSRWTPEAVPSPGLGGTGN